MADDVTEPTTDSPGSTEPELAPELDAEDASDASPDATADAAPDAAPKAAAAAGSSTVVSKKVTSKRVTPKGGAAKGGSSTSGNPAKRSAEGFASKRYTPPVDHKYDMPSPWWVPAIMWALLAIGVLVIMLNYMGVFGDPSNVRLVIGLGCILGGIITATQYR